MIRKEEHSAASKRVAREPVKVALKSVTNVTVTKIDFQKISIGKYEFAIASAMIPAF